MVLSTEEVQMLKALSAVSGVSQADIVRQLVRRAHSDMFEHRQLRLRVLAVMNTAPLKPSDFVGQLAGEFPPTYVQWNINTVLDRMVAESLASGDIHTGYVITSLGRHARGF